MPSSLRPSTISVGYSSACSSSVATGRISFSTNERTAPRISVWMSLRPSVSHRRGMRSVLLWWRSGRSERYWWVDGLAMTHLTSRLVGPPALLRRPVPAPEQQWPQARKPVHQRQPDPWVVGAVALRLELAAQRPTLVAQVTHVVQHPGCQRDGDLGHLAVRDRLGRTALRQRVRHEQRLEVADDVETMLGDVGHRGLPSLARLLDPVG